MVAKAPACRDLPPCEKVNIPPVSFMNGAWKGSDRTGGKDSSSLDDVETKCPCKFLSQTHCSPRAKSKQACQTQLAGHYGHTMVPCVWGPTKTFPRLLARSHLCTTDRVFPFKTASFLNFPLITSSSARFRSLSLRSHPHGLSLSLPLVSLDFFYWQFVSTGFSLWATCAIFSAESKMWKAWVIACLTVMICFPFPPTFLFNLIWL